MTTSLLLVLAAASAADVVAERPAPDREAYQPFVLSTAPRSLDQGSFAVELGGGFDGLRPPEEGEEGEEGGSRGAAWWESGVGLGGGVQLETALQVGDLDGAFALTQGRAEVRAELIPRGLGAPVDLTVGAGWAIDGRRDHAVTAVVALGGRAGPVDLVANARLAHVFDPERDPLDVRVSAGALVRATRWLRAGVEYTGAELEERDEDDVDGGGRHYVGPTLAVGLARDAVRLDLTAGAVLAAWGVGPLVQGSVAWRY